MIPYTYEQTQAIIEEIEKQTDRGAAIIARAATEDLLEHLIAARLVDISGNRRKALFEQSNGPLATLSSRIELAFALGLFDDERRHTLRLILDVGNAFAHAMDPASFDDSTIQKMVEGRVTPAVKGYTTMSTRTKFLFTFNITFTYLFYDGSLSEYSSQRTSRRISLSRMVWCRTEEHIGICN